MSRGKDTYCVLGTQYWTEQTHSIIRTTQCGMGVLSLFPLFSHWCTVAFGYYTMIIIMKNHCFFQPKPGMRSLGETLPPQASIRGRLSMMSFYLAKCSSTEFGIYPRWVQALKVNTTKCFSQELPKPKLYFSFFEKRTMSLRTRMFNPNIHSVWVDLLCVFP